MAQSNASKAVAEDAIGAAARWFSVHTADPGTTGANEMTGTGAARGQTTWNAANPATGTKTGSEAVIGVPAGTATHWGLWTASSGGTFHNSGALPVAEVYAAPGTYGLTPTMV
jgi:hypothetical protein